MTTLTVLPTTLLAEKTKALKSPVTILDDFGHVDKDRVHVRTNEELVWLNAAAHDVQIVFDEPPPFDWTGPLPVAAKGQNHSGRPKMGPGTKSYKYTVVGSQGNYDPAVIIDP